jgi:hypothetical protein
MIDSNEQTPVQTEEQMGGQDQSRGRSKRGAKRGNRPQFETSDPQRQPKNRSDRSAMAGYGDGVERAMCLGVVSRTPGLFPVHHRTGIAVRTLETVDRTESSILLCDVQHEGPHIWPNGDIVGGDQLTAPVVVSGEAETERLG